MAKKKVIKQTPFDKEAIGNINIQIYADGTYDLDTKVNADKHSLAWYANVMADLVDGKVNESIIQKFVSAPDELNQNIGQFLAIFLKTYKIQDGPLIPPDKVFGKRSRLK